MLLLGIVVQRLLPVSSGSLLKYSTTFCSVPAILCIFSGCVSIVNAAFNAVVSFALAVSSVSKTPIALLIVSLLHITYKLCLTGLYLLSLLNIVLITLKYVFFSSRCFSSLFFKFSLA